MTKMNSKKTHKKYHEDIVQGIVTNGALSILWKRY